LKRYFLVKANRHLVVTSTSVILDAGREAAVHVQKLWSDSDLFKRSFVDAGTDACVF
jgi:hypothetical protein